MQNFNPKLFREVVEANAEMLKNSINNQAFNESFAIGNPVMTEDETRQMAVNFFIKTLAKELHNKL